MRSVLSVDRIGIIDPATGAELMVVKVARAPFNVATTAFPLALTPAGLPPWDSLDGVKERGRLVRKSLRGNPAVANAARPPRADGRGGCPATLRCDR